MPLGTTGSALSSLIFSELQTAMAPDFDPVNGKKLADALGNAIAAWIAANGVGAVSLTAATTTVAPGIAVATAGTPAAQTGATTAPGAGTLVTGTGVGNIL